MDYAPTSTASSESATSGEQPSLLDLEQPIYDARSAARVLRFLLDEAMMSKHPSLKSGDGYTLLWLGDDIIDALGFTATNLLIATGQAAGAFKAVADARK
jgi:hypothetical protein